MEQEVIKISFDLFRKGQGFELLFERQLITMEVLKTQNKIGDFPFNLNEKAGQKKIREYVGYLVEELTELHESYERVVTLHLSNAPHKDIKDSLVEVNMEAADCLHFYLEILIMAGIDLETIKEFIYTGLKEENLYEAFSFNESNLLKSIFQYAASVNVNEGKHLNKRNYYLFPTLDFDYEHKAGSKISPEYTLIYAQESFTIISKLFKALSLLKKKEWRDSGADTDLHEFHSRLLLSFMYLIGYFDLLNLNETSILANYIIKNEIVLNRLKENY
jgi:NTP pyrophosphatase (non-canonical NTP hydrolase)